MVRPTPLTAVLMATTWVTAQIPFHDRGPGELLPPGLREGPPAGRVDADLTVPAFFWAFHRDALRPASTSPQLPAEVRAKVIASLLAASRSPDAELRWQSLWALARVVRADAADAAVLHRRVLGDALLQADGALGEVACVAAGLACNDDARVLAALARVATTPAEPERRRAFAFYGLGLAASASTQPATQFRVLAAVERALLVASAAPQQVRVASLHALALTRSSVAPKLQGPALALLERAWQEPSPVVPIDFAAHVPIAVAALVKPDDPSASVWRERFAAGAAAKGPTLARPRSCVIALGALCPPWHEGGAGKDEGEQLRSLAKEAPDLQVRYFALVAMGQAGGAEHRAFLLRQLGGSLLARGWAGIGLAMLGAKTRAPDVEVVAAFDRVLAATKDPSVREALAAVATAVRREPPTDPAPDFHERYGAILPGAGDPCARIAALLAVLDDATAALESRCLAATALGHLGDPGPRHWSADLARAIDYRSATPVLVGLPNGVLRLP